MKRIPLGVTGLILATATALSSHALAATALDEALQAGATQLDSEELATRLVGHTVTAQAGERRFLFHYSADNVLSGRMIGGDWSDTGYYGITDDDRVCLSMSRDRGRLRCLTVLEMDGRVLKFNVQGENSFELLEFQEGNRL